MEKLTYTVRETAIALNISACKVYDLLGHNIIPHIRVGRRYVVPVEALREWLKSTCKGDKA